MTLPSLPLIVLTDLDGTLLDHDNYDFRAAMPALACLRQFHIPCIFNSSKTFDEMLPLRESMNNHDPFVSENGGAVFIPKEGSGVFHSEMTGSIYNSILNILQLLREQGFRFRGFHDMSDQEVADITGLKPEEATLARRRHASEPLIWQDDENRLSEFASILSCHNLRMLKGGRFIHVMGSNDKSEAVTFFREHYQTLWDQEIRVIALGDGENDLAMLESADYPIVIPGKHNTLKPENPATRVADKPGPAGWNDTLLALLNDLTKEVNRG
jgi:mannosyl-3-phosphoglycerate phosphatase